MKRDALLAAIGMDRDPEYVAIARARIAHWTPEQPGLPMEVAV